MVFESIGPFLRGALAPKTSFWDTGFDLKSLRASAAGVCALGGFEWLRRCDRAVTVCRRRCGRAVTVCRRRCDRAVTVCRRRCGALWRAWGALLARGVRCVGGGFVACECEALLARGCGMFVCCFAASGWDCALVRVLGTFNYTAPAAVCARGVACAVMQQCVRRQCVCCHAAMRAVCATMHSVLVLRAGVQGLTASQLLRTLATF